jgi:hypothetical protein
MAQLLYGLGPGYYRCSREHVLEFGLAGAKGSLVGCDG